jgi:hypothetical protein
LAIVEFTGYFGTKSAVIEKLVFQRADTNQTITIANYQIPETSLPDWDYYSYAFDRDRGAPDKSGYYVEVELGRSLVREQYSGSLEHKDFDLKLTDDQVHVDSLAGHCQMSWN